MCESERLRNGDGYDRLAPVYALLEQASFGRGLMRTRTALLHQLPEAKRILILGDGDGRLLEQLALRNPNSSIRSIDISSKMLQLQQQRLQRHTNIEFVHADATAVRFDDTSYDLIVTAFFLDCFTASQLCSLLSAFVPAIQRGGHLYYADFALPPAGFRRFRARCWLTLMHAAFRWLTGLQSKTLTDPDEQLCQLGMQLTLRLDANGGMQTTRIYQRLRPSKNP